MATRGRPKSDQKRTQILEAAADLFTTQGYANTSLEQVAAAAGVSKQTIYSHFDNKADVLREGVRKRCLEGELTKEHFDLSLPAPEFLLIFATRFINTLTSDTALRMYRLCLNEGERYPEVARSFYESGPELVRDALTAYLEAACKRGELRIENCQVAASQFLFMVRGLPVDMRLLNVDDRYANVADAQYIQECCDMFLRAYA